MLAGFLHLYTGWRGSCVSCFYRKLNDDFIYPIPATHTKNPAIAVALC